MQRKDGRRTLEAELLWRRFRLVCSEPEMNVKYDWLLLFETSVHTSTAEDPAGSKEWCHLCQVWIQTSCLH